MLSWDSQREFLTYHNSCRHCRAISAVIADHVGLQNAIKQSLDNTNRVRKYK